MLDQLRRLFWYDNWANCETMESIRSTGDPLPRAVELMAHIVAVEWLWYDRLHDESARFPSWPSLTLNESESELRRVAAAWKRWIEEASDETLHHVVRYVSSKGEEWEDSAGDILTQVTMHSAYHRGQIASELRAAGHTPAVTDYIQAARERLIP